MKHLLTLILTAGMTLAVFSQTPITTSVSMNPTNYQVRGTSTNFHVANADRGVATVGTVSTLAAITTAKHGAIVDVRGYDEENDLPYPIRFTLNTNSVAATNRFTIANAGGSGRWVHDWDGDVRAFGAIPYQPKYTLVPWGYKSTNSPIGTGAFSIYARTTLPSAYTQPYGLFSLSRVPGTNTVSELAAGIGLRATPDVWGILFRGIDASSTTGTNSDQAASLDTSYSALSAYAGQTVDIVFTRSGTNVALYFNGTDVTGLFTNNNPAGWSKSLALGESVFTQVGNNENIWYWPKPVTRFATWDSALSAAQAANPSAVGSKVIDFTPDITTEPSDLTDELNSASDYLASKGGGVAYLPPGVYRVDGSVRIGKNVHWKGAGSSAYPSSFRQGFRPGATVVAPWFGASSPVFIGDQSQSEEVCLTARTLSTLGGGIISSRWLRSTISDMTISGGLAYSSEGILLDRVAAITLRNLGFQSIPGEPIRAYGANSLQIVNCDGTIRRGLHFRGVADVEIEGCFLDGGRGPGLTFVGNLSRVVHSVFEYGLDPRSETPNFEWASSADTSSDVITITSSYGHRLRTGQVVMFDAAGGTLPSPLVETNVYYAIVTGANTLKVSTQYVDEVSKTGAYYSNNVVDITTSGSGTWYTGPGRSVGMLISGDHNSVANNQSQNNYEGGLRLEGPGGNNSFTANQWILNGLGNTNTEIAGVRMVGTSYNSFLGNKVDDRDVAGYSQLGFALDSYSDLNLFIGNSSNVDRPFEADDLDNQFVLDSQGLMGSWNGDIGNLYVPSRAGFATWNPRDFVDSAAVTFDRSNKRLFLSSDTNNVDASWYYAPAFPWAGPMYVTASSGTMSMVNNGTGQTAISINTTPTQYPLYYQVNSDTSVGFDVATFRNYGTNSSTYAALPSYTKIGELLYGGWYGANAGDVGTGAGISFYSDALGWNSTNRMSQANILVTPANSSSRVAAVTFNAPTSPSVGDTMILMTYWNGSNWVASAKRVSFHTNDSAGVGYKALKVPN